MPVVRFSDVGTSEVRWLWQGRIPLGAITLLDGDAGMRKSTLSLNLAASVSAGRPLPGEVNAVAGGVLLLGEEDGIGDTVLPRLQAMGADLQKVHTFSAETLTFADDLPRIDAVIRETGTVLVIVDPLSHFLGVGNGERRVRTVLTQVRKMAETRGVALLAIRHLAKERLAAQQAGLGSVAIGAVARSGLLLAADPSDGAAVILAQYKCNLAPRAPSLQLRFDGVRLSGAEPSNLLPDDLARPTVYDERTALGEAMKFLQATLSEGGVRTGRVTKLAASAGIKYRTLRKAKDALGVEAKKSDAAFDAPWYWRMPGDDRLAPQASHEDAPPAAGHLLDLLADLSSESEPEEVTPATPPPRSARRKGQQPADAEDDVETELSRLTGLGSVKQSVRELRGLLAVSAERKRAGLPTPALSFHAIFAGNPGTGKTTVARIYAKLLKQYGRVAKGQIVEVDRSDLVGQYIGETAVKTRRAMAKAIGGVLFIDEAYALKTDAQDFYGQECIDTVLKFIEDHREEMVAILAGYPAQMDALLTNNPGFRSRFTQRIVFADYDDGELISIFRGMLEVAQYRLHDHVDTIFLERIAIERGNGAFGNARAVRNLLEGAIRRHAVRIDAILSAHQPVSADDLVLLLPEDFLEAAVPGGTNDQQGLEHRLDGDLELRA